MEPVTAEDAWDFYPCRIDEEAASIFLNLRYATEEPPATATTLYRVRLPMQEPDEHGMGSAGEAAAMNAYEDELVRRAAEAELLYVGRIRTRATWELVFYGAAERTAAIQSIREVFVDRRTYVDVRPDPSWGFYREFLLPDDERIRWMHDRRLVQVLQDEGDVLATPRRVDHWAYFASAEARDRFVTATKEAGFELQRAAHVAAEELPYGAQIYRADPVELEHIHDVVMDLIDFAAAEGGDYDGWETSIERDSV